MRHRAWIAGCVLVLLLSANSRADEPVAWPVPAHGAHVAYRTSIDFSSDVVVGDARVDHVHLEREHAVRVEKADAGVEVVVTHGRRWGTLRMRQGTVTRTRSLPPIVTRRSNVLAGHAEAVGTRVTGPLFPPPPPEAPRVGLEWEAGAIPPVGAEEDLQPIPATFRIAAVDDAGITVEIRWPDTELEDGSAFASLTQTLTISRADGLPLEIRFEGDVRTRVPYVPQADLLVPVPTHVVGTMARRAPAKVPESLARVEALILDLAADAAATRRDAAVALGGLWPDGALAAPALIALRGDEDETVRAAAARSLAALGDRGIPEIAAFLRAADDADRRTYVQVMEVILVLGAILSPAKSADLIEDSPRAGALLSALWWADSEREHWTLATTVVTPLARRVFQDGLELSDAATTRLAAACAAVAGCATVPRSADRETPSDVIALLDDERVSIAATAALVLGRLGVATEEVLAALRTHATREDAEKSVRKACEMALWLLDARLDAPVPKSVPSLMAALDGVDLTGDSEASAQGWRVVHDLVAYGKAAAAAVPLLEARLAALDPAASHLVTGRLASALCRIAGPRDVWVDLVVGALRGEVETRAMDRFEAGRWIDAVAVRDAELPSACVERLRKVLDDLVGEGPVSLAPALMRALGRLGPAAAASLPTIFDTLDVVEDARKEKIPAAWDPTASARWLVDDGPLFDVVMSTRFDAVEALGGIGAGAKKAVPRLERLVAESDPAMRTHAARALRRIRGASGD